MEVLDRLLSYAPPLYRDSKLWESMMRGEAKEFEKIEAILEDISKQLLVDTATWGLAYYEDELGIKPSVRDTLTQRRNKVKAMMRGGGTFTHDRLEQVVKAYVDEAEIRYDITNQFFTITIIRPLGVPKLDTDLRQAVDQLKPAHIGFAVIYTYMSWGSLKQFAPTWGALKQKRLTWEDVRTGKGVN